MEHFGIWAIGFGVLVVMWMMGKGPSLNKLVKQAVDSGDVEPILAAARELKGQKRSFFYQRMIELLWNGYHRNMAAKVIRAFAEDHPDAKLSQYWLRQLLELEADIARNALDDEFLQTYYHPDVAAMCGVASS